MNVVKVSCCGLCALLKSLKVGDADIYLIILPMHLTQGKELAIFNNLKNQQFIPLLTKKCLCANQCLPAILAFSLLIKRQLAALLSQKWERLMNC